MGRRRTVHTNMPDRMRPRKQRSGRILYYYDTGGRPRKEIPLGDDFILALRKYSELIENEKAMSSRVTLGDVMRDYEAKEIPRKARSTQATQRSDMVHLLKFFDDPPVLLHQVEPVHLERFLEWKRESPTTANRCKRLFSHIWNKARAWGYTSLPNPATGIQGHALDKREVYIDDGLYKLVRDHGSETLRDAMDLIYFCGHRPGDAMNLTEDRIVGGELVIRQSKTKAPLRIQVVGELAALIERLRERKSRLGVDHPWLLVNERGGRLTKGALRYHFERAREAAGKAHADQADKIAAFWLYDLRAKAADDVADAIDEQAASNLLGHNDVRTTKRHYLRRGKKVAPVK
ncbi:tyrosine-type recombinase/integrase [Burkholderia gladioli]|uniref:tyrosine-type recombinase/integrase n=1 Tax=Burkholderia gladioli TaxID=28095 RepID=UPI0016418D0F|nr:tyrosine-type recombinase/integrase [Burkholderia gladioli]